MLAILLACAPLQAREVATRVEGKAVAWHESLEEVALLFPPNGLEEVKAWVQAVITQAEQSATFPARDCALIDATFSATAPPSLSLRGGLTTTGQPWDLPATTSLPDVRMAVATAPITLIMCSPGGTPPQVDAVPWPDRLDPKLDTAGLRAALTARVRDYTLPLWYRSIAAMPDKSPSIARVGAILQEQHKSGAYTDKALYADPAFWSGSMELPAGQPLVDAAPALAEIAAGRLEAATLRLDLMNRASDNQYFLAYALHELYTVYGRLIAAQTTAISESIALHDAGDFAGAIARYDQVLAATPCMAWAIHERALSQRSLDGFADTTKPNAMMQQAFACNPLYPMGLEAQGKAEVRSLLWRMELRAIEMPGGSLADRLVRYADAALELGQPGVAGQVYLQALHRGATSRSPDLLREDLLLAATEAGAAGWAKTLPGGPKALAAAQARRRTRQPPGLQTP